ncbi:MAG: AMP-binding protein [Pseudomonadales bacterium]
MSANFFSKLKANFINDKVCLEDTASGQSFTYADINHITSTMAHWLTAAGLKPGERVMVQVEKSPANLFWYLAALRCGLIYLPLNTAYQPEELEYFVGNAEPSLVICDPAKQALFQELTNCQVVTLDKTGSFSAASELNANNGEFTDVTVTANDTAVILYTSGTTGRPKGAMISHGNLLANTEALSKTWHWQQDDVMLHALPIFHIHGLFVASHLPLYNSSTIVFLAKFSPELVLEHLPRSTVYMGVPTNYTRLLQNPNFNEAACQNMRLFTSGSAPLLPQTFDQMRSQTGFEIVERYGMTETGMNTSNPLDGTRKPGTVGPVLEGVQANIVADDGKPVANGQPGDLLIKGANVFRGYWQMPEKTAEEFTEDGYFRTGDIASMDQDGYISIVGRGKDLVISGGLNVYPKEIEAVIDRIAGVKESAVIGVPHADFGEAVTAIVVAEAETLSSADIESEVQKLASFKRPKQIHFVDELPRNTMGKVQKNLLRERFSSDQQS